MLVAALSVFLGGSCGDGHVLAISQKRQVQLEQFSSSFN